MVRNAYHNFHLLFRLLFRDAQSNGFGGISGSCGTKVSAAAAAARPCSNLPLKCASAYFARWIRGRIRHLRAMNSISKRPRIGSAPSPGAAATNQVMHAQQAWERRAVRRKSRREAIREGLQDCVRRQACRSARSLHSPTTCATMPSSSWIQAV